MQSENDHFRARFSRTRACAAAGGDDFPGRPGARSPRFSERLGAALAAFFLPARSVEKYRRQLSASAELEDIATIIFSSGSTGEPKGVVLTHYNVASNVEQLNQVFSAALQRSHHGHSPLLSFVRLHGHAVPARRRPALAWCFTRIRSIPESSARSSTNTPSPCCWLRRHF